MNEIILSTEYQPVVCACDYPAAYDPFYHLDRVPEFNDLIYVVEGTMYVSKDGTDYDINAGELLFLKHHVRHYGVRETRRGTSWYYAHFYLDEPGGDTPRFTPDPSPLVPEQPLRSYEVLPKKLGGLKNSDIEQKFADMVRYCHRRGDMKMMRINNMFASFLMDIALLKYMDNKEHTLSRRICDWLDKHCNEPFSAPKLEKKFFLSYKRLAAVFKEEQGMTMQRYHTERRMLMARDLPRSTLLPVNEIAASVGYDDPLYFSRYFHAFSGVSPKDCRHSAKSEY